MSKDTLKYQIFEHVEQAEVLGVLAPLIVRCICNAFEEKMPEDRAMRRLKGDLVVVVSDQETNEVVGFSSSSSEKRTLDDREVEAWYLDAATVSLQAQGRGIYKEMNKQSLLGAIGRKLPLIYTRTQNPRIEEGLISVLEQFRDEGKIVGFQLTRELVKAAYGRMLTKSKPVSRYINYDELDYEQGDAYVLLFSIQYGNK